METTTIFSFRYQSCVWPRSDPFFECSGYNSGTDLVVNLEYTFFQLFFQRWTNFCYVDKIQRKLCKDPFCRSNQPHKLHSLFSWRALRCSKWPRFFFRSCLSPTIVHLHNLFLLSTLLARILLIPMWVSRQRDKKM